MVTLSSCLSLKVRDVAKQTVQLYAQGILTVELLAERMIDEWEACRAGEDNPSQAVLTRIAQRICSRELCAAWRSPNTEICNCAFNNLRRHLENSLQRTGYAGSLQQYTNATEDVLHQTLETLYLMQASEACAGPDDPASFLKWTQTILVRNACVFLEQHRRHPCLSLDASAELLSEQLVDTSSSDPLEHVLLQETQQVLGEVISSMRNVRYRQVLISTYLVGLDESELARHLGVRVQEVYMWRHRALKALRDKPEVMRVLRSLLE
jgi:RNA polymerase sigma factor (sigma-70 family)